MLVCHVPKLETGSDSPQFVRQALFSEVVEYLGLRTRRDVAGDPEVNGTITVDDHLRVRHIDSTMVARFDGYGQRHRAATQWLSGNIDLT
jgi:hypothetical protein